METSPTALPPRQSTDAPAIEDPPVTQWLRFLSEHGHERIEGGDVAAAPHVTRRTLERRFRSVPGRSIAEEVARLRVEGAKRLLTKSKRSIKRLAPKAGFRHGMQMCTVFKRVDSVTPSEFRRQRD